MIRTSDFKAWTSHDLYMGVNMPGVGGRRRVLAACECMHACSEQHMSSHACVCICALELNSRATFVSVSWHNKDNKYFFVVDIIVLFERWDQRWRIIYPLKRTFSLVNACSHRSWLNGIFLITRSCVCCTVSLLNTKNKPQERTSYPGI